MAETISQVFETIVTDIGSVVEFAIFSVSQFATKIVSEPLLLMLVVAVPLCGIGVGMLRRLINTN